MTRLEFLSMSLIKGLKGVIYIGGEQEIVTLKSIDTDGNEIWVSSDNWVYSSLNYDIKIICRKLSDLTKEIEHKGERFIPIVELLKIEQSSVLKYATINHKVIKIDVHESSEGNTYELEYSEPYSNMEDGLIQFSYSERFRRFGKVMFKPYKQPLGIGFQLDMFQKLIEWKFNLMDKNEPFIDVNTLDVNPYK